MKILQIDLKRFLSHYDTSLVFKDDKPYLFVGKNGSGKSSAVKDSITWALFGESRARGAGDDLIYNAEKTVQVGVVFEVNGQTYRVLRERERGKKTAIQLFKLENSVYKEISNVTASKTQEDIEKILGFNYHLFAVSACLEQNTRLNFSELTPKECRDTIMQILDIDKYNTYEKIVRDRLTALEREASAIEAKVVDSQDRIKKYVSADDQIKTLKEQKEGFEVVKLIKGERIVKQKSEIEIQIKDLEEIIGKNQNRADELRSMYKGKEQESLEIAQVISVAGAETGKLQQKVLKIKKLGNKCPTCELEIATEHIASILADATKELEAQQKIQTESNPKFAEIRMSIGKIEEEGKALRMLENQSALKDLNKRLIALAESNEVESYTKLINNIEKEIAELQQKSEIKNDFDIETVKDKQKIAVIREQIAQNMVLQQAFGKTGIPAMIISNITNELEFSINAMLRELTSKNISVKVSTEKNLKSKDELSDTLEIVIRDGVLERPYSMYSGGEKYRIDMAIRLALSKILARRNNFMLDTLIIDEPSGLDKEGLASFKDTIIKISKEFKRIFVVSHLSELVEDAQGQFKVVEVSASNGVSTVKIT
jgi:DNA repair exonuclease SbcCD ATPase subunit